MVNGWRKYNISEHPGQQQDDSLMPTHGRIINHFRNTDELPKDQVLPHMVQHERSRVASICLSQG